MREYGDIGERTRQQDVFEPIRESTRLTNITPPYICWSAMNEFIRQALSSSTSSSTSSSSTMRTTIIGALLLLTSYVYAQHQPQFATLPRLPKELPPGFEQVLPHEVIMRLRAVHENSTLTAEEQHEQIDQIMSSLPEDLIEKLPQPPGFENLPQNIRDQLKAIHHDRTINWRQRHDKIRAVLDNLPPHLRPQMPPPPSFKGARSFRRTPDFAI